MQFIDGKTWEPLKTRGLYFCHLNVNSLLSKIGKLRDITDYIGPAILGITESKLDSSVTNVEVNINGYSITSIISISIMFSKFSYQELNLLQSEYFTDLRMQMIFLNIFSNEPLKFIFSETLISTDFKMENLSSKKISHINLKISVLP